MATKTATISKSAQAGTARPYAPAWLHAVLRGLERLPGSMTLWYVLIAGAHILIFHAQEWSRGAPVGTFDQASVFWGVLPVAMLWIAHDLERTAGSSFDASRPLLTLSEVEAGRLRYELTVIPAVPALVVTGLAVLLTAVNYATDPVAGGIAGLPPIAVAVRFPIESFAVAVLFMLVLQLLRQMWRIRRALDTARVDVFAPGPLHAFSRLTSRGAIAILLVDSASIVLVPSSIDLFQPLQWMPYVVMPMFIAALVFFVPLLGLHGRLEAEKERLEGEVEVRLQRFLGELNQEVDRREYGRADDLNKTLASLVQQRAVLAALPTWPWSTGTLRAVATAILLPVFLFLVQRLLDQLL